MRHSIGRWIGAVATLIVIAVPAGASGACGFDTPCSNDAQQQFLPGNVQRQDTPNDSNYDEAEPDGGPQASTNLFDERFDLFGFPSARTEASATYKDPSDAVRFGKPQVSGFNAAGAWKITRGDPSVDVAILDTGINWGAGGLRTKVRLNEKELPTPEGSAVYDKNGDGVFNVDDYASDSRVNKPEPTGQDLIRAFSDGTDADGNGYVDDIAGWDFFDDDNDPTDASSYFAAENHGSGRTQEAVERGNDADGSIGVCPKCQFVPLRIWDTFVSDQNSFAMAITYATDNQVEVIEGADGGLYHSAFAEAATKYAYDHGVAQLYSGDDLNTGNHNFPGAYDHTQLVQGTVPDTVGLGQNLPSDPSDPGLRQQIVNLFNTARANSGAQVATYFRGANTTQFGGKSSISMEGATGSTNTGKAAGAAALVIAAARENGDRLTADETRELLEQTAEDVLALNTAGSGIADPAQPGFDTHFGYGRVDLGAAVAAADAGATPPEASIGSPQWYAPVTGSSVPITGLARDRLHAGQPFTWTLEYGVGLAPTSWTPVNAGTSSGTVTNFGTLPLDAVRAALAADTTHKDRADLAGPTLDPSREDPYKGQFTVRLTVDGGSDLHGVDRKVLTALDDPTLRSGFPKRLAAGGEAPLRYADLDGDNRQELVVPTEDGRVHAYEPDGSELPGWPVRTQTQYAAARHLSSPALQALDAPLEPPRAPTIADLDGDGRPEVITTAGERIYVWDAKGDALPGWPVRPDATRANCAPSQQSKPLKHPKCGFLAAPAIAHLGGRSRLPDVVVPGLDGRLRAYQPDGRAVPGFPVRLIDPVKPPGEQMTAESINHPAIGDLNGDGRDDVVVPTNEVYGSTGGGGDVSFGAALSAAGTTSRVYAVDARGNAAPAGKPFLPGWPIALGGIIQDVLPLIGPGHDPALVKVGGTQQVVVSTTGGALSLYGADGQLTRDIQQQGAGGQGALNLFESAAVGDVDGTGGPDVVKYQIDLGQAANLLLVGQNVPYSHRIGAYNAASGTRLAGFPVITDDYQFLSSSTVARVGAGAGQSVLAGTGLGLLHAYDGTTGRDAAGFPKVTGGWLFAPAALSDDGRLAGITREGWLYEWSQPDAPACQTEWPSFRHDQQGTGNYDADGTPPATPERIALAPQGGDVFRLTFRSPGDDVFCGTAERYVATLDSQPLDLGPPVAGGQTLTKDIRIAGASGTVVVKAQDDAANRGPRASARVTGADGGQGGGNAGATGNGSTLTPPIPGAGSLPASGSGGKKTAKLAVLRARVRRDTRRLDVLATITQRASGRVQVAFRSAGRTIRFSAPIDSARRRVRFAHAVGAAQARLGTGIVTLTYPGAADTRSQTVRLRAATQPAHLLLARPRIAGDWLQASGTLARAARGVVRVQLEYQAGAATVTRSFSAPVARGRWSLNATLSPAIRDAIARRTGTVHSYTLFTGYLPRRIRGELRTYQVLAAP